MTQGDAALPYTHIAYSDESHYSTGRYRCLGMVTLESRKSASIRAALAEKLSESDVTEFKWAKLRIEEYRSLARELLTVAVEYAVARELRIDVLIWDTHDSRHAIRGRDDIANLQRMYYHLFKNVLSVRWPNESIWRLCPDEQSQIAWDQVQNFLELTGARLNVDRDLFAGSELSDWLKTEFAIHSIVEAKSHEEALVQLADLFAGLCVYSRECYGKFDYWEKSQSAQMPLFAEDSDSISLSNADKARCPVLAELTSGCRTHKLGVSLKSSQGLRTFDPKNPINFWWYTPQHENDRAPTRQRGP